MNHSFKLVEALGIFLESKKSSSRKSFGLKGQFIGIFTIVVLICLTLFSACIFLIIFNEMRQSTQQALRHEYSQLAKQLGESAYDKQDVSMMISARSMYATGFNAFNYVVYDSENYLVAKSDKFPENLTPLGTTAKKTTKFNNPSMSGWISDLSGKQFYFHLIAGDKVADYIVSILVKTIVYMLPIGLFFAFIGGWFAARSIQQRLKKLTVRATGLKLGHSNRLDVSSQEDELDQLSVEFNKLLDRIESDYQRVIKFTADASHELRLPITAIKGEAEIVLSRARDVEDYRRCLTDILEEFDRLSSLVQRLLQLARSDSGVDLPEKSNMDVFATLEKIVDFFQPAAEFKKISIVLHKSEPMVLFADLNRIREMISNLIDNALKYTLENGHVEVGAKQTEEGWIEIFIRDDGIGISMEDQPKIFERFHRVSQARERTGAGGDGLGLAIAQSIAKSHGGEILVQSVPMKGSTFTIRIPSH